MRLEFGPEVATDGEIDITATIHGPEVAVHVIVVEPAGVIAALLSPIEVPAPRVVSS